MAPRLLAAAAALLLLGGVSDPPRPRPEHPTARASYSLGHQIGTDLLGQGAAVDLQALREGLLDGLAGADPAMEPGDMQKMLADLKRRVRAAERVREREEDRRLEEKGREYLSRNGEMPGVVVLESGLQYQVLREGSGASPGPGDKVVVHYTGKTLDGKVFHDTQVRPGKPETLHVSGVILGLTEALQRMKPGGRWRLFIPPELAYGRRGPLAGHTVIFDVDLLSIVPGEGAGEVGP